jgi:hypothetical protein
MSGLRRGVRATKAVPVRIRLSILKIGVVWTRLSKLKLGLVKTRSPISGKGLIRTRLSIQDLRQGLGGASSGCDGVPNL